MNGNSLLFFFTFFVLAEAQFSSSKLLVPVSVQSHLPSSSPVLNYKHYSLSSGSEELKRMAHSKARATDGKVTYPPGVKEISDKISKEEMVRRLKVSVFLLLIFKF